MVISDPAVIWQTTVLASGVRFVVNVFLLLKDFAASLLDLQFFT